MDRRKVGESAQWSTTFTHLCFLLLAVDSLLTLGIVARVPYTKIDWDAYMSQVTGFLAGERNYANLRGDTGPLVYPAGFLYIYSAFQYITHGAVFPAQIVFVVVYILNLSIVLVIYKRGSTIPWWALCLLCLSKRVHSIFVLRLFNDCIATLLAHASIALFQKNNWNLGMVFFSAAVSVKMNVLLYAPSLLVLMLKANKFQRVVGLLGTAALVQILLGLPFLITHPLEYISRAFNLGRVFIYFWSVNFKFIPEKLFLSKHFAILLLILHLGLLFLFAQYKWCKHEGGILRALRLRSSPKEEQTINAASLISSAHLEQLLAPEHITTLLFTGNFIGILCARSLHYQFYCWYFYSLPFLLWKTPFSNLIRLILFGAIELCWNIYPSNQLSSLLLIFCHVVLLFGLSLAPPEYPYIKKEQNRSKVE